MKKSRNFWKRNRLSALPLILAVTPGIALAQTTGLLGDAGGVRTALGHYGITININDTENLLGNLAGGVKQGATMQGVATGVLEVDTGKAFNLPGGTFHISALQIHGQPLSGPYLDNLQAANGNEGEAGTRLWELWYDQQIANTGLDIKLGQQSIDNEFISSVNSGLFVNTMAGWPLIPSDDMYGGGPAYPLSSLGARVQAAVTGSTTILAGVFDDNPGGGGFDDDAQRRDRNGGLFNLNTGALLIAELQYATKIGGQAGTYKLGGWYDTGSFPDQRYGTDGLSLASPDSNGDPKMHKGNYSLYAVVDQAIWSQGPQSLSLFGRIMGAPADQNLIGWFFNGGATLTAPLPGCDDDQIGLDLGIGTVSSRAAGFDRDTAAFSGSPYPVRGTETLLELTYQAHVTPWLTVQPDMQYIFNPGGGTQDPNDPSRNLRDEFIAGARANVAF